MLLEIVVCTFVLGFLVHIVRYRRIQPLEPLRLEYLDPRDIDYLDDLYLPGLKIKHYNEIKKEYAN